VTEPTSPAVAQARADVIAALVAAGERIIANLDGATEADRDEADRLLEGARFHGIVLNELLIEEGGDA
jgi:hypothetical protein